MTSASRTVLLVLTALFVACTLENATVVQPARPIDGIGSNGNGSNANGNANSNANGTVDDGVDQPLDWEPVGEIDTCDVDVLTPPSVYVRRVKNLMTGQAPTNDELGQVVADPASLSSLVQSWFDEPAFRDKLTAFLTKTLQQFDGDRQDFGPQAVGSENIGRWSAPNALFNNLEQSFARTVMGLIDEGRPFTEIATTRTWMMTTGMVSFMLAAENGSPRMRFYHQPFSDGGVDYDENTPFSVQLANKTFYSSTPLNDCSDPFSNNTTGNERNTFRLFMLGDSPGMCEGDITLSVFNDSDFQDWRSVEMTALDNGMVQPSMFDAPTLRGVTELPLRSSRTGFFSTPAFLAGWRTNVDNSFRVTTNQMLIAGLGLAFEDSDISVPLGDDGLAEDHASPGTQCFGCHKNLDPMRNFFANEYDADTYAVEIADQDDFVQPSFSFQGHSGFGDNLEDLGSILGEHPFFAEGWTQKLCMFANSKECDRDDPEFQRIVNEFESSNFDFEGLVVNLFASPLVTGAECVPGEEGAFATVSLARRDHLCTTLETRLDRDDACRINGRIRDLVDALPADGWARGSAAPDQATEPSLFYTSTLDSLCGELGSRVINQTGGPLQSSDIEGSLRYLVEEVMAIPPSDPLHSDVSAALQGHYDAAGDIDGNARNRLRSTFIVACSSALLGSTDL